MNCFSNINDQIFHKNFRVKIKLDNTLSTNETVVYNVSKQCDLRTSLQLGTQPCIGW